MRINLSGRLFSLTEGRASPPSRGDYVAYGGAFYPVSAKSGYPMSIVADIAAKAANKIVLVPGETVIAFLSGSGRIIHTQSKPADAGANERNEFARTLLRLTLLSNHREVVAIGDIPLLGDTPCERVDVAKLDLPPVIRRSRTWIMFGAFVLIVAASLAAGAFIKSQAREKADLVTQEAAALESEMTAALDAVKEGRQKLATPVPDTPQINPGTEELSRQSDSFLSDFFAGKSPATNQIRVTNGKFQY